MLPRASYGQPSTFKPLAKSLARQPRLLCCYVPNGKNIIEWLPKNSGPRYTLPSTPEPLKELRGDFSTLSGLGYPPSQGGHSGADT